ncbi:hypothetical protein RHGRI_027914 [Rhododendron griersonianum]|uniref:Uncharacterized protein n=1 Tax=Rhododendron griersonianum TaxID=479676 RepID=A0AAV6IZG2_9ERIC|nr:hypothetical protein RHGRI_027914 [Rhododendron griersonianum]
MSKANSVSTLPHLFRNPSSIPPYLIPTTPDDHLRSPEIGDQDLPAQFQLQHDWRARRADSRADRPAPLRRCRHSQRHHVDELRRKGDVLWHPHPRRQPLLVFSSAPITPPPPQLQGNPICLNTNLVQFCGTQTQYISHIQSSENSNATCPVQSCPYEYAPSSPLSCFCAAPLLVGYRLKSLGFTDFRPYKYQFEVYLTNGLDLEIFQLYIDTFIWEEGPRLKMNLKFYKYLLICEITSAQGVACYKQMIA